MKCSVQKNRSQIQEHKQRLGNYVREPQKDYSKYLNDKVEGPAERTRVTKAVRLFSTSCSQVGRPRKDWSAVTLSLHLYPNSFRNSELYATRNCLRSSRFMTWMISIAYVRRGTQWDSTSCNMTVSFDLPSIRNIALTQRKNFLTLSLIEQSKFLEELSVTPR